MGPALEGDGLLLRQHPSLEQTVHGFPETSAWPQNHGPTCPTRCPPAGARRLPHLRVQAVDAALDLSRHGPLLELELS